MGPKTPEDLDGEKATLHQLKMESEPLRQAVDMSKRLPSLTKIHHVRGGEIDINPRAAIPAAPHMQPQSLWRVELHLPSERSRETKTATHWPVQPDEEFAGLVSDMVLHWRWGRWRR